jgi:hypothetical protein
MPPCWTRTQLSGCLHYPTCGSGGAPEHLQPQRANGHRAQTAGAAALDNMGGQWRLEELNGQYLMYLMSSETPQALTRTVQDFRSQAAGAVVLENGAVAFDLVQSKLLHFRRIQPVPPSIFGRRSESKSRVPQAARPE